MDDDYNSYDDENEENLFPSNGGFAAFATSMLDMMAISTGVMDMSLEDYMDYNNGNPPKDEVLEAMTKIFVRSYNSIKDGEVVGFEIEEGAKLLVESRGEGWVNYLLKWNEGLENYEYCKDLHDSLTIYQIQTKLEDVCNTISEY